MRNTLAHTIPSAIPATLTRALQAAIARTAPAAIYAPVRCALAALACRVAAGANVTNTCRIISYYYR